MTQSERSIRLLPCFLLFLVATLGRANSQTAANATLDHADITGAALLKLSIVFDKAPTCSVQVFVTMRESQATYGAVTFSGSIETGQKIATLSGSTPNDLSGTFQADEVQLNPCPGFSKVHLVKMPQITLNVRPISDPNSYPSTATASLLLTQKQLLETKEAELRSLSGFIDTRVEQSGRDSIELRSFLAQVVRDAEAALTQTEISYQKQILKPSEKLPPFFSDFRRQYDDLSVELRAPIPGTRVSNESPMSLVYVQQPLQRRAPQAVPSKSGNRAGTSPAIAIAVQKAVNDNASAYNIVSTTGVPRFHVEFSSRPTGASIYYRQAISEDFMLWSSLTDTSGAEFDLATFVFKFHKDGCRDEPVRTIDPYYDTHPRISVEFRGCSNH